MLQWKIGDNMSKKSKQQIKKLLYKECLFCGEDDYDLLDVHRVLPGSEKGTYHNRNTICCCSLCHRKCHSGRIKVLGKHLSTTGRWVVHYTEDGEEHWKNE